MTSLFFGLLATLAVLVGLAYAFSRMETKRAAQGLRVVLGLGGVVLGTLLTIRGMAVVGGPIVIAGLGFLGTALRGGTPRAGHSSAPASQSMSRKEAASILGVNETASEAEIRKAYRDMMKRVHPDTGGSDALAAQVKQAYDVLLGEV